MISYISEHKIKRIVKYNQINLINVKIGNIIYFNYNKATHNKNPHVLVLNTNWKRKLHGLVIDYMTLLNLAELRDFIIEEAEEVVANTPDSLDISLRALSSSSQTPSVFYTIRLKQYLKKYFPKTSIYRIYDLTGIHNIKLVIYNFNR